ncbi:hypothetical protein [Fibrobacter sp. UWB2]|jgi:hypothetical protein|uniref:hypothetical protein n=1 Tax=Fibrobacter sp. UWB2 TaxID=1964358 RepID=UPI00118408BC|nr:hypothetical protein [Fibrobacter sp. UWB2]
MKRLILLLATTLFFMACANKSMTRYEALAPVFEHNGFEAAINEVKKQQEDLYGEKTEFLYYFDLGVLYHYNGNYKESAQNFDKAEKIYDDLYTHSVTNEAAAIVTNDNIRPYRARPFEVLVLHEMQIMNYLAQRDIDGAMVEVSRAQKAMTELYQKDNDKTNDNGFLRYLTAIVYEMAGEPDEAAIAYYKTVRAYDENILNLPKEAREFVIENLIRSDREDDLKKLKLDNSIETTKAKAAYDLGQEIIIVGYAGHGPILTELKMSGTYVNGGMLNLTYKDSKTGKITSSNIGAPPVAGASNGETFHISFALPEAHSFKSLVQRFNVTVDNKSGLRTEKVMALDKELEMNLKDDFANTMTRTAIRVVLRTIAAQAAKKAMKSDNAILNLFTSISTDIAQDQMEKADLRIALFLPNSIQMTRIPVEPGSHEVSVAAEGETGTVKVFNFGSVPVKKGEKKFIFVPAVK